jgi:hypothetical protein
VQSNHGQGGLQAGATRQAQVADEPVVEDRAADPFAVDRLAVDFLAVDFLAEDFALDRFGLTGFAVDFFPLDALAFAVEVRLEGFRVAVVRAADFPARARDDALPVEEPPLNEGSST